jgi:Ser/Thr protein kinase RdoA (MazF antagonist)
MNKKFPVTHSILSTQALIDDFLRPSYDIKLPMDCRFLLPGLNDTFLVDTQCNKYILRIYRKDWRSLDEIFYELEVLQYLDCRGVSVSIPIARKDGDYVGKIDAPEGLRYAVLFTYAPGKQFAYKETEQEQEAYLYGKIAAKIHTATDSFQTDYQRFSLDSDNLLDAHLRSIQPFLSHRPEDWNYLTTLAGKLTKIVKNLPANSLDMGFCHGDFHCGNSHFQSDGALTFFDFDCCGIGYRSYDIAVFRWGSRLADKEKERWPSFLHGYTENRHLSDLDLQATTYFIAIRHFFLVGLHTSNGHDWGFGWLNDGYFDRALKFFREWETE